MKILPVDLNNMEHCNFAGLEVDVLKLNGKFLWTNIEEQVGLDLNYTGLDVNGKLDGSVEFDGAIVAYAVGKPSFTYYKQVEPTPTTKEGYYGYYFLGLGGFTLITSETDFDSIVNKITVGTTICYELVKDKSLATNESVSYPFCNGYNSEYYNGYDFSTRIDSNITPYDESLRIVPETLKLPLTHNDLPVTTILDYAFDGGVINDDGQLAQYNQGAFIKDIIFGSNIQNIKSYAFFTICNYGTSDMRSSFDIPTSIKEVGSPAFVDFGYYNSSLYKLIVPESSPIVYPGSFDSKKFTLVIYKSNIVDFTNYRAMEPTTFVFKKSVKEFKGQPFSDTVVENMVFEHTDEDEITINITGPKTAKSTNIYTDSTYVRNYNWAGKNITPTFYSLSEYTGELE